MHACPIAPPLDHLVYSLGDLPHKQPVGDSTPGFSESGVWIDVGLSRCRIDMYRPSLLEGYFNQINQCLAERLMR